VIAFNLLKACDVEEIMLAGFDGFSVDINENYYNQNMRHPVNTEQAERRNNYYKNLIARIKNDGVKVEFVTTSLYQ
jgi:4-hydroxy 2-oxovalerate aldolase